MTDDAEAPLAEPTVESRTLEAVDAALEPVLRMCENVGVVSYSQLKAAIVSLRQALAHVVYGPPAHPTPEPVDALAEQQQEQTDGPAPDPVSDPVPVAGAEAGSAEPVADPMS